MKADKADKRESILDAAQELMSVMPDNDISVQLIASKAGIGKGSVYYYFGSKEEIINAVIERCYKKALREYLSEIDLNDTAIEKIKCLFRCMIKEEYRNNQKNFIIALHLHDDPMLHNKMKLTAIEVVSPVLAELLRQGNREGSISTDTPDESAEMIVGVLTFLFDTSVFQPDYKKLSVKMKMFARVLETCLKTPAGSFDFLFSGGGSGSGVGGGVAAANRSVV